MTTRKRIKLSWIANSSARRTSLRKRRLGLVKKTSELSTLCGAQSGLVIFSPGENDPMVWPSHESVRRTIERYRQLPDDERLKKCTDLEKYTKGMLAKTQEKLVKMYDKNNEAEVGVYMLQMHQGKMMGDFDVNQLRGMIWLLESRLVNIRKCVEFNKKIALASASVSQADGVPPVPQSQDQVGDGVGDANANVGPHLGVQGQVYGGVSGIGPEFVGGSSSAITAAMANLGLHGPSFADGSSSIVSVTAAIANLGLHGPSFADGSSSTDAAANLGLYGPSFASGPSFAASSSSTVAAANLGLYGPWFAGGSFSTVPAANLGLHGPSFGSSSSFAPDHGVIPFNTFIDPSIDNSLAEGGNFGPFGGHDMGPGHFPFGPLGSGSSHGNEFGGYPFGFGSFGGDNDDNGTAASTSGTERNAETGPFDDNHGPNNP